MDLIPGTTITLYHVCENSDKTEGRGYTIHEWWFECEDHARLRAQGRGPMGTPTYVSTQQFFVGADKRLYSSPNNPGPALDKIITSKEMSVFLQMRHNLNAQEHAVLKKWGEL